MLDPLLTFLLVLGYSDKYENNGRMRKVVGTFKGEKNFSKSDSVVENAAVMQPSVLQGMSGGPWLVLNEEGNYCAIGCQSSFSMEEDESYSSYFTANLVELAERL